MASLASRSSSARTPRPRSDGPSDPGAPDKRPGASAKHPRAGALPEFDPSVMHRALVSAGVGTARVRAETSPSVGTTRRVTRGAAFDARARASEQCDAPCGAARVDATFTRRAGVLLFSAGALAATRLSRPPSAVAMPGAEDEDDVSSSASATTSTAAELRASALAAFNARDFPRAVRFLTRLAALEPDEYAWREALAQCFVDGGGFAFGGAEESSRVAVAEYTEAIALLEKAFLSNGDGDGDGNGFDEPSRRSDARLSSEFLVTKARLLAGRALAYELNRKWSSAIAEYDDAVATAARGGAPADPLILNQKANALAASGDWAAARLAYLESAQGFRDAGKSGSAPREKNARFRADGVAFASSNAALALAELGDLRGAEVELRAVSRRAPGLVDARAALAALYWASGRPEDAEREWEFACDNVDVGCAKYRDPRWVAETRRWPPAMAEMLRRFLGIS